jgi:hypothetical protein
MASKNGPFDQPNSLMVETTKLLKNANLVKVSYETGIPFYWLRKFKEGVYTNPSVNRVQCLFEHLSNTKLI